MEPLPHDEASEGEDEPTEIESKVTAQVHVVDEGNAGQPGVPKLVYMSFKRKEGDAALFGRFVKQIMGEMEKFMEPPNTEEEPEEPIEELE